jgi:MFS transporter, ACS family, glucarate transporter
MWRREQWLPCMHPLRSEAIKMTAGTSTFIRRNILGLLAGLSLVSYMLRSNISIAAKFMKPELGLDDIQMGQVFSAFMLGYALFQIPAGWFGDRKGPRLTLALAAALWGATTLLTGVVPATGAFVVLLGLRFLLGAAEAATYPVAARAVANWFPLGERTFANAVVIAGATLGMVFNGPLISSLMEARGWRATFFVTSALGWLMAVWWWWYATNQPEQHARVKDAELIAIYVGKPEPPPSPTASWRTLLRDKNIGLISLSYFLDSFVLFIFVFWFYPYLTDERGFSILKGGVYNSLPYIFALALLPTCGQLCDALAARIGRSRSRRAFAICCLLLAAIFLILGANVSAPLPAILCLSLAVGFLMSTEGMFWSSMVEAAGENGGTAGGVMNTAGNLAGVVSTALAPVLVKQIGWVATFAVCAAMLVVAGLIWMLVRVEQPARDAVAVADKLAVENS